MGLLTGMISGTWGEVLEGLAGMAGGAAGLQPVKETISGARARAAGRLPLPENHDLVRGIRTAWRLVRRSAPLPLPRGAISISACPS